jgi:hypothetical protein
MAGANAEPNSILPHWYAAQRAKGIRVRGLYSTKDTFVSVALQAGVKIAWLENQTGVNYLTLRRHYGKWMPTEGASELARFRALDPTLFGSGQRREIAPPRPSREEQFSQQRGRTKRSECERGDLNHKPPAENASISKRADRQEP